MKNDLNISTDRDISKLLNNLLEMSKNGGSMAEKENAKCKINKICLKYGVEYESDNDLENKVRSFKYSNIESKEILSQCIFQIMGSGVELTVDTRDRLLFCVLDAKKYIEVINLYKNYWDIYKKQRYQFLQQFIHENKIGTETKKIKSIE